MVERRKQGKLGVVVHTCTPIPPEVDTGDWT